MCGNLYVILFWLIWFLVDLIMSYILLFGIVLKDIKFNKVNYLMLIVV